MDDLGVDPERPFGPCEECGAGPWTTKGPYVNHWRFKHGDIEPPEDATPSAQSDPKPKASGGAGRGRGTVERLIREQLEVAGTIWAMRDDVCGPVLIDAAPRIAAAVEMVCESNPKLRARILSAGTNVGYLNLAMAAYPVLVAIREHHVTPRIERMQAEAERRELAAQERERERAFQALSEEEQAG